MPAEFDVVVVGAGLSGGLPVAAYLQKAGAKVALIEQDIETGRFYRSYEVFPGVLFDVSPVNFSCLSPVMLDLELESYGYHIKLPQILHSVVDGKGLSTTIYPVIEKTAQQIAKHSERDAKTFRRVVAGVSANWTRLLKLLFFSPNLEKRSLAEIVTTAASIVSLSPEELSGMNGPSLVEFLFESDFVRRVLIALPALNLFGDLRAKGQGALTWIGSFLLRSCIAPAGNQSLPNVLERAFLSQGGVLLRNTMANKLILKNGRCVGVRVSRVGANREETILARKAVVSDIGASLTLKLLGHQDFHNDFRKKLQRWETSKRVIAVHDFVMKKAPKWKPALNNPDFGRSPRFYLVWDSWNEFAEWLRTCDDRVETFFNDIEVTQEYNLYGTDVSRRVALRVRHGTGPYLFEDDEFAWDEMRERFTDEITDRLGSVYSSFAEDVAFHQVTTPLDFWRTNPAAYHGNPVGGDFSDNQWIFDRVPYRTPVKNLYMSNSVWPPALSWMAAGYNAACVVAEDLGIRHQPWWAHEPGEWFMRKLAA